MQSLQSGHFLGYSGRIMQFGGNTLTENEYATGRIDWHYHEHAYFTFILSGQVLDATRTKEYHCPPGTLVFHQAQEPHCNIIRKGHTKSVHLELKPGSTIYSLAPGIIENPDVKIFFHLMYKEIRSPDPVSVIEIENLLANLEDKLNPAHSFKLKRIPLWVNKVKEIIYDQVQEKMSLDYLSAEAGVHRVHLCRDFSKYFHCSLAHYMRKIKVERALTLLSNRNMSLTEIAFDCGFADQSHFLRCFKQITGTRPSAYRKIILR